MKQKQIQRLCEFLYSACGSWRNAAYIDCGDCPYKCKTPGVLLIHDRDGKPLLVPVSAYQRLTGMTVDKAECLTVMSMSTFSSLYSFFLSWMTDHTKNCVLQQLLEKVGWEPPCNT